MSNDTKFIDGLIFKAPNQRAPEYVKARGSIKVADLIAWLQQQKGEWVNFDLKESQGGKLYAAVDTWKPNHGGTSGGGSRGRAPQRQGNHRADRDTIADQMADDFADDGIRF